MQDLLFSDPGQLFHLTSYYSAFCPSQSSSYQIVCGSRLSFLAMDMLFLCFATSALLASAGKTQVVLTFS